MSRATYIPTGGIGFFGWLIIIGLLGYGPCADNCYGCGPTLKTSIEKCENKN